MRVNLPDYDRTGGQVLQARRAGWRGVSLQDLVADLAGRDLAQRDDGRLVAVGLDERRGAGAKLARAIGRSERQLEAVRHSLQAIVDGDTSHTVRFQDLARSRSMMLASSRRAVSKSLLIIAYLNSPACASSSLEIGRASCRERV